jgi:hypothetical protein
MTERQGIEIDYCPKCRGVWLDRGELDRIVERSIGERRSEDFSTRKDDHHEKKRDSHGEYHQRKKKSFFGDLFD